MTHIRHLFWIPKLRQRVSSIVRKCVTCLKVNGRPYAAPIEPPLPKCRLEEAPPFTVTGVDFTGTLCYANEHSKLNKCYIVLFTCAVTRNVHLELVTDLSTAAFIRAFRRFTSRRSVPSHLISDNASTFISAARHIKEHLQAQPFHDLLATLQIKWSFIPKRAPWFGGFYERLIGITKTALRKALGRSSVSFDELQTIVVQTESLINARPLTTVSNGEDDLVPLTPAHLLYGRSITTLSHTFLIDDDLHDLHDSTLSSHIARHRLQNIEETLSAFWERWRTEYLALLRERHERVSTRGTAAENRMKVGDIVLVRSDHEKRVCWPLAKIMDVVHGADGMIRSANIKTANGKITNRPITKLYPLELATSGAEQPPTIDEPKRDTPRPKRLAAETARSQIQLHQFLGVS